MFSTLGKVVSVVLIPQPVYQYVWSPRYIDAPICGMRIRMPTACATTTENTTSDDANFNVTTLVDTAGDAVERYVYSPYGVLTVYDATWANIRSDSSYAVEYTYTGRRLDLETGLYYYRHRMYHSQLGRFVSRDPVGYSDPRENCSYVRGRPKTNCEPRP